MGLATNRAVVSCFVDVMPLLKFQVNVMMPIVPVSFGIEVLVKTTGSGPHPSALLTTKEAFGFGYTRTER